MADCALPTILQFNDLTRASGLSPLGLVSSIFPSSLASSMDSTGRIEIPEKSFMCECIVCLGFPYLEAQIQLIDRFTEFRTIVKSDDILRSSPSNEAVYARYSGICIHWWSSVEMNVTYRHTHEAPIFLWVSSNHYVERNEVIFSTVREWYLTVDLSLE